MNNLIRFGEPIEPPLYQAELPFDFSANSTYNTKVISENTPFQVYLLPSVWGAIWEHVNSSKNLECSGLMLGRPFKITNGSVTFVMVVGSVPHGSNRRSIGHITIGPEEIAETRQIIERDYPDLIPVGWYHSHPGHGIFLSGQDMVIVRSIYNLSWHIALVVDPIHNTAGVFRGSEAERLAGWLELKNNKEINWKEWVLNQSVVAALPNLSPSIADRSEDTGDMASPVNVELIINVNVDSENHIYPDENELSQQLAERDFQQAQVCLEAGDEIEASRLIYTLQRKHPEFQPDEVNNLKQLVDDLRNRSQTLESDVEKPVVRKRSIRAAKNLKNASNGKKIKKL